MSSYKLSIEPLGYNNYPMWQQRMKDVLRKEGLLTAVEPKPEGSRAAALTEAEQDKALGLLRLHLDDSKLSEVQELDTALKVWTCLASTHQKGARAQRYQFRSEWAGLKQVSDERIAAYVQRLRTASANMRSSGQAVDATEEVMTLLHGLTDPYRTIVSVWQVSPTPPENMEAVLPSLLAREQELIENSGDEALALYSSRQQNSKRGSRFSSRQLSSHSHSQPGLSAQAAYAGRAGGQTVVGTGRQRQRSGQQQPWRTAQPSQWSDKRCYSCGEVGHIAAQCPRGGSNVGGDRSGNGPRAYTARGGQEVGETVCGMNVFSKEDITVVNKAGLQANARHEHAWVMDSGASLHCTPCRSMLHEFRKYSPGERALVQADGKEGKGLDILGEGLVYLRAKGVGRAANSAPLVRLRRVLWVPRLATNLFSVAKAVDSGAEIAELSSDRFSLTWKKEAMVVGHRQQSAQGGLYIISCKYTHSNTAQKGGMHSQEVAQAKPAVVKRSKADRLHRRMGHLGYQNLEKLLSMADGAGVKARQVREASKGVCEECQEGKKVAQSPSLRRSSRLQSLAASMPQTDPLTLKEAKMGGEWKQWEQAMQQELSSIEANHTWTLAQPPPHTRVLPVKWVYKKKQEDTGVRYKARLVAKGFAQREGVDYFDLYAPVGKHNTLRMLLSIAAAQDLEVHQLDITTAFLNGKLDEEVWVQQPEGFEQQSILMKQPAYRLHKALYGLKQAPRAWHNALKTALEEFGFEESSADAALYTRKSSRGLTYLLLYVDDVLVFDKDISVVTKVKQQILSRFKGRDLGEVSTYLGIQVTRDRKARSIRINQSSAIGELIAKYGLSDANSRSTPLQPGQQLVKEGEPLQWEGKVNPYAEIVGSLLYISNCTRPDISYAAGMLARFSSAPTVEHMAAAKGVLRYLAGTQHDSLMYKQCINPSSTDEVKGYGDADYAGCKDSRRSTTGYVFRMNGGAVSWCSKRQAVTATSTAEAEYIAAAATVKEALWLRKLLQDLQLAANGPMQLFTDNQAALALLTGSNSNSQRAKHIDTVYHFARERVERGEVAFNYCPSSEMPADILTKSGVSQVLGKCKHLLGVMN